MKRPFLTDEHEMYRKSVRKYIEKEVLPNFEKWEEARQVPLSYWKQLGELGFLCPWLDEEYGGMNADFGYSVVFSEELEKVGTGISGPSIHSDIVMPYIASYASKEQKDRWLKRSTTGEIISSIAMTEPGTGSDLASIKATAIRNGDHYVLNGEKTFISNGYSTNFVIIVCKTDPQAKPAHNGISLLVVDAIDQEVPGFKKGKKLNKVGQHAGDTSELIFEDVKVPVENLLGEEGKGFYYLMEKLQQERLKIAIGAMTAAERMLEITMEYIKQRTAFGRPISKFQNTQFKVAEMATQIQIGRTFVDNLIVKHMNGEKVVTEVSMAKWWTTDMAKKVATECMQLHGGYGYMEEYEIARRYRDIPISSIYGGTNEIMKVIIAKNLGL